MNESVYNHLRQWSNLINKEMPEEDFWIETPFGSFKNPRLISEESELNNEITFTIKYDEWIQQRNNKSI
jgi:frataxin-like iron-binding protein CyaY